jgi:hypothetical protein
MIVHGKNSDLLRHSMTSLMHSPSVECGCRDLLLLLRSIVSVNCRKQRFQTYSQAAGIFSYQRMVKRLSVWGLRALSADYMLWTVQRLFTMFPTGTAGGALLMLRVSVVATLVFDGAAHWPLVTSFWPLFGIATLSLFLCMGLFTPYCSLCCCLLQGSALVAVSSEDRFHLAISILNSGILAGLGPGAYSVDARIFGRRRLTFPPHR